MGGLNVPIRGGLGTCHSRYHGQNCGQSTFVDFLFHFLAITRLLPLCNGPEFPLRHVSDHQSKNNFFSTT